jgi:hypothetical protein
LEKDAGLFSAEFWVIYNLFDYFLNPTK